MAAWLDLRIELRIGDGENLKAKPAVPNPKEQMASDVAFALNSVLSYGAIFSVMVDVCWTWTEFHGKVRGCPYWTEMALMQRATDRAVKLKHEHVVPKKVVIGMLTKLNSPTPEEVFRIWTDFSSGSL